MSLHDVGLVSPKEGSDAFLRLTLGPGARGAETFDEAVGFHRHEATQALTLALAGHCPNPNATWANGDTPVLFEVLNRLRLESMVARPEHLLSVSWDSNEPWPSQAAEQLSARERLALWLIRAGADPWVKNSKGLDALDLALLSRSRTVVATLMDHPLCPPLADLHRRASGMPGRQVPWLCLVSYDGSTELFEDLVHRGWDITVTDRQGWGPLAWANSARMVGHLLDNHAFDAEVLQKAPEAWQKRELSKLVSAGFQSNKLKAALERRVPALPEDTQNATLAALTGPWLAASPSKKSTFGLQGVSIDSKNAESMSKTVQENWDWRFEASGGTARGSWSLLGAAIWGNWRGSFDYGLNDKLSALAKWIVGVLEEVSPEQRMAWLNESIRDGMTNRGMVGWLIVHNMQLEKVKAVLGEDLGLVLEEMLQFAAKTKTGSTWIEHFSSAFPRVTSAVLRDSSQHKTVAFWRAVETFASTIGFTLSSDKGIVKDHDGLNALLRNGPYYYAPSPSDVLVQKAHFKAFVAMCSRHAYREKADLADLTKKRARWWNEVLAIHDKAPDIFVFTPDMPSPFTEEESKALSAQGFGRVMGTAAWKAMVRESQLNQKLSPVEAKKTSRPRM